MARPSKHLISRPHPAKRYIDKIRLLQFRRGPTDDRWEAIFFRDGKWQTRQPHGLGTRDFEDACEVARDKYGLLTNGQQVTRTYTRPEPPKPKIEHPIRLYANRAAKKLSEQAIQADAEVPGKGHNYRTVARRIEHDLVPRWGDTDIRRLDEHALNDWIEDDYRVEDRDATVAKYGGQSRTNRQQVMKMPSVTTLGNLDHALLHIWQEAVADKVVERRTRPVIDKSLGEDSEPRVFIDETGVQAVFRVMTDGWIVAGGHSADLRRMLRAYLAMISTTGIRAGLEAKRVRIGYVKFDDQRGVPVILIRVEPRQGKYAKPRNVIVYEGDRWVSVRRLLREHIAWRIAQGATDRDYLFAWPDGTFPAFRRLLDDVLRAANALIDPMTGEKRVAYSFRHYFATKLIGLEAGLSVPVIAEWLGTSSQMIERHYNQYLTERNAYLLNGISARVINPIPDPWRVPADDELDEMVDR